MLFSVITVTYNSADSLQSTIESVARQSYNDFEYIVVDGASTDNTEQLLEKYTCLIDIVLSEPDENMYEAINKGVRLAGGEFIVIVNAGDLLYSDALSNLAFYMQNNSNADVYVGCTSIIDEYGKFVKKRVIKRKWPYWAGMPYDHQACVVRRSIYLSEGFYNERYSLVSDYDFILRLINRGVGFELTNVEFNKFRIGGMSSFRKSWRDLYSVLRLNGYSRMVAFLGLLFRVVYKALSITKRGWRESSVHSK